MRTHAAMIPIIAALALSGCAPQRARFVPVASPSISGPSIKYSNPFKTTPSLQTAMEQRECAKIAWISPKLFGKSPKVFGVEE